jgi:hypothetical protein
MRGRLKRNIKILKLLVDSKPSVKKRLINSADADLICTICECADNTLRGNVSLTPLQKRRLTRHKKILRRLARRGDSWKAKKRAVVQVGSGFFPALLAPIISGIASLFL